MIESNKLNRIDWKFLEQKQGYQTSGYVPKNKQGQVLGASGVTISVGIDLGYQSLQDFKEYRLSIALTNKLKPYLGLKKNQAVDFLQKNPLVLSENQCQQLVLYSRKKYYRNLEKQLSTYQIDIDNLPNYVLTILFSISYQHGAVARYISGKQILNLALNKKYAEIADLLLKDQSPYKSRRKSEGATKK